MCLRIFDLFKTIFYLDRYWNFEIINTRKLCWHPFEYASQFSLERYLNFWVSKAELENLLNQWCEKSEYYGSNIPLTVRDHENSCEPYEYRFKYMRGNGQCVSIRILEWSDWWYEWMNLYAISGFKTDKKRKDSHSENLLYQIILSSCSLYIFRQKLEIC